MPIYDVTISRTELITFRLEAADSADADARALADGDEEASRTTDETTVSVELAQP
jgi:hypothetical protein